MYQIEMSIAHPTKILDHISYQLKLVRSLDLQVFSKLVESGYYVQKMNKFTLYRELLYDFNDYL